MSALSRYVNNLGYFRPIAAAPYPVCLCVHVYVSVPINCQRRGNQVPKHPSSSLCTIQKHKRFSAFALINSLALSCGIGVRATLPHLSVFALSAGALR